jgi:hypothetical protein
MNSFNEIYERIEYQKKKIIEINTKIDGYINENLVIDRYNPPATPNLTHIALSIKKQIPVEIKEDIGSIAHVLRACLDSLICKLSVKNGKDTKNVAFPISESKEKFNKYRKKA